jgi:hypothetical protein
MLVIVEASWAITSARYFVSALSTVKISKVNASSVSLNQTIYIGDFLSPSLFITKLRELQTSLKEIELNKFRLAVVT